MTLEDFVLSVENNGLRVEKLKHIATSELSPGAQQLFEVLPTLRAGHHGKYKCYVFYKRPWGKGTSQSRTKAYYTKAALAHALFCWAGDQAVHRVMLFRRTQ